MNASWLATTVAEPGRGEVRYEIGVARPRSAVQASMRGATAARSRFERWSRYSDAIASWTSRSRTAPRRPPSAGARGHALARRADRRRRRRLATPLGPVGGDPHVVDRLAVGSSDRGGHLSEHPREMESQDLPAGLGPRVGGPDFGGPGDREVLDDLLGDNGSTRPFVVAGPGPTALSRRTRDGRAARPSTAAAEASAPPAAEDPRGSPRRVRGRRPPGRRDRR